MAKKTKDSDLPIEERLEQALIPNWDEPYKLPDNWCWLKLLSAFENCTDSKKKIQQKDYLESGLWSVVDQGQSLVGGYTNDETMLYNGNLPVIIFGDHTRCVKYIDFNFAQGADGVKVLRPKPFYLPKFFFYAFYGILFIIDKREAAICKRQFNLKYRHLPKGSVHTMLMYCCGIIDSGIHKSV